MRAPLFVCLGVLAVGCGRVHFDPTDAQAGLDAGRDAGPGVGLDAATLDAAARDAGTSDAALDAAIPDASGGDAGTDAGGDDAGTDVGTDAGGTDAGSGDAGTDAGPGIPLRCGDFVGPAFCETAPDATLPPRDPARTSQGTIQPRVANGRMYLWSLAGSDRRLEVHRTDGTFLENIAPPPGYSTSELGVALSVLGDVVAVGAPTRNAVLIYRWTGATHAFVQEIVASPEILSMCRDGGGFTFFGRDVALEGQTLVTTARRCLITYRTPSLSAPAYAFVQRTAPDTTDANFGSSLELAGGVAIMYFDASVLQVADVDVMSGTFAYRLPRPPASYGGYITHVSPSWIASEGDLGAGSTLVVYDSHAAGYRPMRDLGASLGGTATVESIGAIAGDDRWLAAVVASTRSDATPGRNVVVFERTAPFTFTARLVTRSYSADPLDQCTRAAVICADDTLWVPFDPTASSGRSVSCTLDRYDLSRL